MQMNQLMFGINIHSSCFWHKMQNSCHLTLSSPVPFHLSEHLCKCLLRRTTPTTWWIFQSLLLVFKPQERERERKVAPECRELCHLVKTLGFTRFVVRLGSYLASAWVATSFHCHTNHQDEKFSALWQKAAGVKLSLYLMCCLWISVPVHTLITSRLQVLCPCLDPKPRLWQFSLVFLCRCMDVAQLWDQLWNHSSRTNKDVSVVLSAAILCLIPGTVNGCERFRG